MSVDEPHPSSDYSDKRKNDSHMCLPDPFSSSRSSVPNCSDILRLMTGYTVQWQSLRFQGPPTRERTSDHLFLVCLFFWTFSPYLCISRKDVTVKDRRSSSFRHGR
jgi:hypothetical protein